MINKSEISKCLNLKGKYIKNDVFEQYYFVQDVYYDKIDDTMDLLCDGFRYITSSMLGYRDISVCWIKSEHIKIKGLCFYEINKDEYYNKMDEFIDKIKNITLNHEK